MFTQTSRPKINIRKLPKSSDKILINVFATVKPGAMTQSKITIIPIAENTPLKKGLYSLYNLLIINYFFKIMFVF